LSKPVIDLSEIYVPSPKQAQAHRAKEQNILYGGAVGGGKTVWLCAEAIQLSLDYPGNRGYLCRNKLTDFRISTLYELKKYETVSVIIDNAIYPLVLQHHQTENYFKIFTGYDFKSHHDLPYSYIYYGGLGDDQSGLSRVKNMTLGWFGIDQVEETTFTHWNWLLSRLRLQLPNIRYKAILSANPAPGWVKHLFLEQKLDDHIYIPALPKDNPHLPENYESNLRKWFPADMVKALLDGNWDAIEGGNFLFRYTDLRSAVVRDIESKDEIKWAGIDVAREGEDSSVFTVRQGSKVIYTDEWSKTDTMETTGLILTKIDKMGIKDKNVNLDAAGLGAGVYDRLKEQKRNVNAIIAGGEAKDKEHYLNVRAEMYDNLRILFEEGRIQIPDDPDLIAQLSGTRFRTASDKKLQLISKEELKKPPYRQKSPDKADSLALAFYEPKIQSLRLEFL